MNHLSIVSSSYSNNHFFLLLFLVFYFPLSLFFFVGKNRILPELFVSEIDFIITLVDTFADVATFLFPTAP